MYRRRTWTRRANSTFDGRVFIPPPSPEFSRSCTPVCGNQPNSYRGLDGRLQCLSTSEDDLSGNVSTIAAKQPPAPDELVLAPVGRPPSVGEHIPRNCSPCPVEKFSAGFA